MAPWLIRNPPSPWLLEGSILKCKSDEGCWRMHWDQPTVGVWSICMQMSPESVFELSVTDLRSLYEWGREKWCHKYRYSL